MRVVWEAWSTTCLLDCQALPCAEAAGCCLGGPDHRAAACRIPGTPRAYAVSLVGSVQETPGLLPTQWRLKPGLGVSSRLLAGRAGSWSLVVWLRDPRAGVSSLVEGLVPDTVEYGVWDIPKLVFTCKGSEPGFRWTPQLGDSGFFFFFFFEPIVY